MKRLLLFLTCILTLFGVSKAETYTLDLTSNSMGFNSDSYAKNDGDHIVAAVCQGTNLTLDVNITSSNVYKENNASSTKMQWKGGSGYLQNTTDLVNIKSITLDVSSGTFTVYEGNEVGPSTEVTGTNNVFNFSPNMGFFKIAVGSSVGYLNGITIEFEIRGNPGPSFITDIITHEFTGLGSVTAYDKGNWSDRKGPSGAVYAGQSIHNNGRLQIRATSPSGIVTTSSPGLARKVTVDWYTSSGNDGTATGRTLDVYGKNSAYETAADLYDNTKSGTKIGSIVCGTSTELEISDNYEYIGLKSNSGAMFLNSISIEWEKGGSVELGALSYSTSSGKTIENNEIVLDFNDIITFTADNATNIDVKIGNEPVNGNFDKATSTYTWPMNKYYNGQVVVTPYLNSKSGDPLTFSLNVIMPIPSKPIVKANGVEITGDEVYLNKESLIEISCENAVLFEGIIGETELEEQTLPYSFILTEDISIWVYGINENGELGEELEMTLKVGELDPDMPAIGSKFRQVLNGEPLEEGYYVISSTVSSVPYAMATTVGSNNIAATTNITKTQETINGKEVPFIINNGNDVLIVKLESVDNKWALKTANFGDGFLTSQGYITAPSEDGTTLEVNNTNYNLANISIISSNNANIMFADMAAGSSQRYIKFYKGASNSYFNYQSGANTIQLYRYTEAKQFIPTFEYPNELAVGEDNAAVIVVKAEGVDSQDFPDIDYSCKPNDIVIIKDGKITGLKPGNVTITASWPDSQNWFAGSATFDVTVRNNAEISFRHAFVHGKIGVGVLSQAAYYNGDGKVVYSSSNPEELGVNYETGIIQSEHLINVQENKEYKIFADVETTDSYFSAHAEYTIRFDSADSSATEVNNATFDFITKSYDMFVFNQNNTSGGTNSLQNYYESNLNTAPGYSDYKPITKISEGSIDLNFTGKYRYFYYEGTQGYNGGASNYELRSMKGSTLEVVVPEGYIISKISFDGNDKVTSSNLNTNTGSWTDGNTTWLSAPGSSLTSVKFENPSDKGETLRIYHIIVEVESTAPKGEKTDLAFNENERIVNIFAGVTETLPQLSYKEESGLTFADIDFDIDEIDEEDDAETYQGYDIFRDNDKKSIAVNVYYPGTYTFRAKYDANKEANKDKGLLSSAAILRLNVFPHLDVLPEQTDAHLSDDPRTEQESITILKVAEDGKQSVMISQPSLSKLVENDPFKYSTVTLGYVKYKHGNEEEKDFPEGGVTFTEDGYVTYSLIYAKTEDYTGIKKVGVVFEPQTPAVASKGNGANTTYTLTPSKNATLQYRFVTDQTGRQNAKRKAAKDDGEWMTAEIKDAAVTIEPGDIPDEATAISFRSYKDISEYVDENTDGDLISDEGEIILQQDVKLAFTPDKLMVTQNEEVESPVLSITNSEDGTIDWTTIKEYVTYSVEPEGSDLISFNEDDGTVTLNSETTGKATLTVALDNTIEGNPYYAEPATFSFLVRDENAGKGTAESHYTVAEYLEVYEFLNDKDIIYVEGFVSGYEKNKTAYFQTEGAYDTNFIISNSKGNEEQYMVVNIPSNSSNSRASALRNQLGLVKQPENMGRKILVWGTKDLFDSKFESVLLNPKSDEDMGYMWLDNQPAVELRNTTLVVGEFNALFRYPEDVEDITFTITRDTDDTNLEDIFDTEDYRFVTPTEAGYYWITVEIPVQDPYDATYYKRFEVRVVEENGTDFGVYTLVNTNDVFQGLFTDEETSHNFVIAFSNINTSVAMGKQNPEAQSKGYREDVPVAIANNKIIPGQEVEIVNIQKSGDQFLLKPTKFGEGYLGSVDVESGLVTIADEQPVSISIDDKGNALIQFAENNFLLHYTGTNGRFSAYKEATGTIYNINLYAQAKPVYMEWVYDDGSEEGIEASDNLSNEYNVAGHTYRLKVTPDSAAPYIDLTAEGNTRLYGEASSDRDYTISDLDATVKSVGTYTLTPNADKLLGTPYGLVVDDNSIDVEVTAGNPTEVEVSMNVDPVAFATTGNILLEGVLAINADVPVSEFELTLEPVETPDENDWVEAADVENLVDSYEKALSIPGTSLFHQYLYLFDVAFKDGIPQDDYRDVVTANNTNVNVDGFYIPEAVQIVDVVQQESGESNGWYHYNVTVSVPCSGKYRLTIKPVEDPIYTFTLGDDTKATLDDANNPGCDVEIYPNLTDAYNQDTFTIDGYMLTGKKQDGFDGVIVMDSSYLDKVTSQGNRTLSAMPAYIPGVYFATNFVIQTPEVSVQDPENNPDNVGSVMIKRRADSDIPEYALNYGTTADLSALANGDNAPIKVTVEKNGAAQTYNFVVSKGTEFNQSTGVETIGEEDGEAEFYDLNGFKVNGDRLEKGIYIRILNGKAEKIMI